MWRKKVYTAIHVILQYLVSPVVWPYFSLSFVIVKNNVVACTNLALIFPAECCQFQWLKPVSKIYMTHDTDVQFFCTSVVEISGIGHACELGLKSQTSRLQHWLWIPWKVWNLSKAIQTSDRSWWQSPKCLLLVEELTTFVGTIYR